MTPGPGLRAHWDLDPEVRFLNHGSFGAAPRVVLEEQARWRAQLERQPVRFMARELEGHLDQVRAALGPFLGADPDDLALLPNATHGLNTVLRSLRFAPGEEVLATSHGYNAARTAAQYACERAGASLVEARVPFPLQSADAVVAALKAAITPRTRLLLIDHVTSPSGLVFPIEQLVRLGHEAGLQVLVDGAHAPGMLPLQLDALGADYYTGNAHKWLCTPKGSAFLHVRRDRQPQIRPLAISHGANDPRSDRSRFRLEFDWTGSADPTAYLAIPSALAFMSGLFEDGWEGVYRHNRELALYARGRLAEALGTAPPAPEAMIRNLVAFPLPPGEVLAPNAPDPLQVWLRDEHRIEVPVFRFPEGRAIRLATQVYVAREELDALADALASKPAAL